jgi:hypothetical protein
MQLSPDIITVIKSWRMRWVGNVARMKEMIIAYKILVVKIEGKKPLRRPERRWEDTIKMDLREMGFEVWTGLICLRIGTGGGLS